MDGFATTAAIRERERGSGRRVRIVAVTAHATNDFRERCLAAGMDAFVSKPIRPAELMASLRGDGPGEALAAVAASTYEGAGIEREQLFERVGGDRALLAELVELFTADYPVRLRTLEAAVAAGDSAAARREAHALKGMVGNFTQGAPHRTAIEVEELASRGELTLVATAASRLGAELELVHRALDALLAN